MRGISHTRLMRNGRKGLELLKKFDVSNTNLELPKCKLMPYVVMFHTHHPET